ncbi:uncharacterized protein A4U43_C01F13430 [Asparagus officinalis]|uniref:Exostosin GT47 domain-containing protein n=1 Tax=Asparagus officinalis TaxID=4686 RepID=A0A5P1FPW0_ASPOF|nr:uncharacterized protein A4U43_C01F13430 [Asparagus officinalis]
MFHLTNRRRLISVGGIVITLTIAFQAFIMPSRIAMSPFLVPKTLELDEEIISHKVTYPPPIMIGKLSLLNNSLNARDSSVDFDEANASEISNNDKDFNPHSKTEDHTQDLEQDDVLYDDINVRDDEDVDTEFSTDIENGIRKKVEEVIGGSTKLSNSLISDGFSKSKLNVKLSKNKKRVIPAVSISEMNQILLRNHASPCSMKPQWLSARDKELLTAKGKMENVPSVRSDQQLYAPAFRNISKFVRSYELMEKILKVYVYKEGHRPIFHQPLLKGIYASEGWFMKLMETNRQYIVKDPIKAHLFYMPFSTRLLQLELYVRNSHNRRNLEQYLIDYVNKIASKYPFWNRTGGSDHFLAACHDWAPYETRHAMEHSIRALCVSNLHQSFQLGKDVSLPTTYVRSAKNPLRDLGGMPATNRSILAFYAGNLHGELRSILLQHWENKYPDMKIYSPLPRGLKRKMIYIQHMKSSKYCICPASRTQKKDDIYSTHEEQQVLHLPERL